MTPAATSTPPATKSKRKALFVTLAKITLASVILFYLFSSGLLDVEKFKRAIVDPGALAYCLAAIGVVILLAAARWWVLLRAVNVRISLGKSFALTCIGNFFNTFMPGSVGGDSMRIVYAAKESDAGSKVEAATTVLIDRVLGLGTMLLVAALGVGLSLLVSTDGTGERLSAFVVGLTGDRPYLLLVLPVAGICLLAVLASPRVHRAAWVGRLLDRLPGAQLLRRVFAACLLTLRRPKAVLMVIAISSVMHCLTISVFVRFGAVLESGYSLSQYVTVVPLGMVINALPGTPQGAGIGEAAYDFLFSLVSGQAVSVGAEICLAWRLVINIWNLLGGLVYVFYSSGRQPLAPNTTADSGPEG